MAFLPPPLSAPTDRSSHHNALLHPRLPTAPHLPSRRRFLNPIARAAPTNEPSHALSAPVPRSSRRVKRRQRQSSPSPSPFFQPDAAKSSTTPIQPSQKERKYEKRRVIRATFERARLEERNGNVPIARALYRDCLALDRGDAHSWLALARLEARVGGVNLRVGSDAKEITEKQSHAEGAKEAKRLFEEGLRECPDSVHLLQAWAVLEHRCGDRDAARRLFRRGAELEPGNPYVCHAWALLEQREGNTEQARELFKKTLQVGAHPEVCGAWAVLEAREGNMQHARLLFEKGLKNCRSSEGSSASNLWRNWAEMEERIGDLPRARELLSKAITSQPHFTESYVALAKLEARRSCTTRALELIATAAGLSAKPPPAVFNAWAQIEWAYRGKVDEARSILQRGHMMHPKDPALLQSLGILEDKCGKTEVARKLFYKSVCVKPAGPAFVAWALLEDREGNYEEANRLFEECLTIDPLHGAAYNAYGMMEARRGNLDKARSVYGRGLKACASSSVWHGYGQLELKLGGDPARARELFRKGTEKTRGDTSFIWHSWGMLELTEKRVIEARQLFKNALKRYPRNSRVLVGAALAEAASCPQYIADKNSARDFFKRAVAADPTHAHAWQAWGVFELRSGREDAARALFRRGLRLCPSHGALWQAWGVLEAAKGDFGKARKLFTKGTETSPAHVHLFQAWACMEVRAGNIKRARELLDRALEFDVYHGPVWNAYGLLEARHGTVASARQAFVTGIRRAPGHAPLYRTFGQTEARAGNYKKARELFRKGLTVDPRHAPLYHALAKFEAMFGDVTALAELKVQAELYFGSEAEADRALQNGEERNIPHRGVSEGEEEEYGSVPNPMELALEGEAFDV
ncbi:TPR repeat-containing protein [Chondrus crispus]|uniref:TPR repeat-containing protein n=1 Tax=Chondrus crispus TaxID=2769 RepID=R7Q4Y4_CHOCR|nr:TPR repeat-containing protein [Chondrus crispus]CDF32431.1 TPR repeat-containing protein [Chondrus crispus]|eukprot:XP_005712096.1 TPR repeat-containing protein [Chondrus crispus]